MLNQCALLIHSLTHSLIFLTSTQLVRIPPPALPLSQVEVWRTPGADIGSARGYILDLAPKVRLLLAFAISQQRQTSLCTAAGDEAGHLPVHAATSSPLSLQLLNTVNANTLHTQVLYQSEPMVDVLVNTRAHNYLEFKAVDGRCVWMQGAFRVSSSKVLSKTCLLSNAMNDFT